MIKITKSLAVITFVVVAVAGATYAWFSDEGEVAGTAATGNIELQILDQNTDTEFSFNLTNMAPGETKTVNFDVKNSGSLPQYLRGAITGYWSPSTLDANKMKVTRVERYANGAWHTLRNDNNGINDWFYYSSAGYNSGLFQVNPDERAQMRLTVELDQSANNSYESKTFYATLKVQARQTTLGADWEQ